MAMTSISHRTPLGRDFTTTQLRGLEVKNVAYTSLKTAKSPISARKQVILSAFSLQLPAASRIASTFRQLYSACAVMPSGTVPSEEIAGIRPEYKAVYLIALIIGADGHGRTFGFQYVHHPLEWNLKSIILLLGD